jgi:predicted membrane chloride channel (bestrophin family)
MTLFSWALFSVEEIGHAIENPFDPKWMKELLNADGIADLIQRDINDIMSVS